MPTSIILGPQLLHSKLNNNHAIMLRPQFRCFLPMPWPPCSPISPSSSTLTCLEPRQMTSPWQGIIIIIILVRRDFLGRGKFDFKTFLTHSNPSWPVWNPGRWPHSGKVSSSSSSWSGETFSERVFRGSKLPKLFWHIQWSVLEPTVHGWHLWMFAEQQYHKEGLRNFLKGGTYLMDMMISLCRWKVSILAILILF